MIVKVQRCQAPVDGPILVYDRQRRFQRFYGMQTEVAAQLLVLLGDDQRGFIEANFVGDEMRAHRRVEEQGW